MIKRFLDFVMKKKEEDSPKGNYIRPFLTWVGGKFRLLAEILPLIPEHNNYFEPFVGGGSVFLNIENKGEMFLSDMNKNLINTWKIFKDEKSFNHCIEELQSFPKEWNKEFYYETRSKEKYSPADFIYMNKMCFNGLYRVNKKNRFNASIGTPRKFYPPVNELWLLKERFASKSINFSCCDYNSLLNQVEEGDFVYLDPPYCGAFARYTTDSFSQEKLSEFCRKLDSKGVKFLLSNKKTDNVLNLYRGFSIRTVKIYHRVGAKSRNTVEEVLVFNY